MWTCWWSSIVGCWHVVSINILAEFLISVLTLACEVLEEALAVVIENLQNTLDTSHHRLRVWQVEHIHHDPLVGIHLLLRCQHLFHKELLQTFICQVDTKLLEAVDSQALEPIDVQRANVDIIGLE